MRASWALGLFVLACTHHAEVPDFYGVRLGMVPRDVRDRFTQTGGTWTSEAAKDDYAITWTASNAPADAPRNATFEFHMGTLVALRSDLPKTSSFASGDSLIVTHSSVLRRSNANGLVHVDLLARDCPTHAAEAKRLAEGG